MLKAQDLAIILSGQLLNEVFQVSDRIHVQRRGKRFGTVKSAESNNQEVLGMVAGAKEAAKWSLLTTTQPAH